MENMVSFQELLSYYKGKKVFITGHSGFKGAWLTSVLYLLGAKVKGYSLAPEYQEGLFDIIAPLQLSESIIADIRNKERLKNEIENFQPDFIFHLAAQPLVRRSYVKPAETFEINVVGTANLLEIIKDLNHHCYTVIITTDKVYENKEINVLYNEEDILGGYDPYSASKACTEIVVNSFRRSFFQPVELQKYKKALLSVRAGNVIGGGDWSEDRIIPDIIRSLQKGRKIKVRNPNAVRPWQHVLEPIGAYLLLAAKLEISPKDFSKAYNIGPEPNDHLTVGQLVEISIANWGSGVWEDISDEKQPHEARLLKLDISRIKEEISWRPKLNASQAIEWTIDWYKQPRDKRADFTFDQIKSYFQ